jgi:hypothetical protein
VADQTVTFEYDWITFSDEDHTRFVRDSKADTRIIECVWDPNWTTIEYDPIDEREPSWDHPAARLGGWRFERIREDKKHPNDIRTVKSVEVSVRDGVTAVELLGQLGIRAALIPALLGKATKLLHLLVACLLYPAHSSRDVLVWEQFCRQHVHGAALPSGNKHQHFRVGELALAAKNRLHKVCDDRHHAFDYIADLTFGVLLKIAFDPVRQFSGIRYWFSS